MSTGEEIATIRKGVIGNIDRQRDPDGEEHCPVEEIDGNRIPCPVAADDGAHVVRDENPGCLVLVLVMKGKYGSDSETDFFPFRECGESIRCQADNDSRNDIFKQLEYMPLVGSDRDLCHLDTRGTSKKTWVIRKWAYREYIELLSVKFVIDKV
jgi:hypothetical protein